jgi:hypothetical protein
VGYTSRSSGLLDVEASLPSVSLSGLKTGRDATMVVHVTPSRRLRRRQVEDRHATGCVGPFYPTFAVFNVLDDRGIVVIQPFVWAYI